MAAEDRRNLVKHRLQGNISSFNTVPVGSSAEMGEREMGEQDFEKQGGAGSARSGETAQRSLHSSVLGRKPAYRAAFCWSLRLNSVRPNIPCYRTMVQACPSKERLRSRTGLSLVKRCGLLFLNK